MKMEPSSESIFNADVRAEDSKVPAKEIGREFVRHYYTMLSEKPHEAGRFYSHESCFSHNDMPEVCGTENIQKAIHEIGFEDCKARIHSIKSTVTVNNGLVLQVCGELALKENTARRFCQTFVLYPQSPKKFYVHNDILQWMDKAFADPVAQTKQLGEVLEDQQLNGHKTKTENITIDGLSDVAEPENVDVCLNEKLQEDCIKTTSLPDIIDTPEAPVIEQQEPEPVQPQLTGPRSWAKMVSSGNTNKSSGYSASALQPTLQPPRPVQSVQVENADNRRDNRQSINRSDRDRVQHQQQRENGKSTRSELTLYVSNIPRVENSVAGWDALKAHLRQKFESYGGVKDVSIPKGVQASAAEKIYAFVDMADADAIARCYKQCRVDEYDRKHLVIEFPNFTGEVLISNRGEQQQRGGASNRSFDNSKSGRGNFGNSSGGSMYRDRDQRRSGGPRRQAFDNPTK